MPIQTILWATVVPSIAVGVVLIALSLVGRRVIASVERSSAPTTAWSILSSLLLAAAFAFGSFIALGKWPHFPPLAGEEWLVYIALAGGMLGAALALTSSRFAPLVAVVAGCLLATGVVFLALANATDMGTKTTRVLWIVGIMVYIWKLGELIERSTRVCDDTGRPCVGATSLPLCLGVAALCSSQAITFSANAKEGMMMGALGGCLTAIGVSQLIWPWRFYIRGTGPTFAALYAGLWLTTRFYTEAAHWPATALGLIAPVPVIILALIPRVTGPTGRLALRPLLAALILTVITAAIGLASIAAAYAMKPPATPYDAY